VVVRSRERLNDPAMHLEWRRRWRQLAGSEDRRDPQMIRFIDPGERPVPLTLYSELATDDRKVCLAIPFPPQPGSPSRPDEV
jgi:hypothetical protein